MRKDLDNRNRPVGTVSPRTVVIHLENAATTYLAVMSPGRPVDEAMSAKGPLKLGDVIAPNHRTVRLLVHLIVHTGGQNICK